MDASDLETTFAPPLAGDTPVDTTLLGVVSTLASPATPFAGILFVGYIIRLVHAGDREAAAFPSFDDLVDMAVGGARLSVAFVVLQLPTVGPTVVSLPSFRPPIAMLSRATNSMMLGPFGVTALDTAGLAAAGLALLLGLYLSLVATAALARGASLAAAIPTTRDLVSDRSLVRVASAAALAVFIARLFVALCAAVPVTGTFSTTTASSPLLVMSATLLGRDAPDASSPGADAARESHADSANAESVEPAESVPSA